VGVKEGNDFFSGQLPNTSWPSCYAFSGGAGGAEWVGPGRTPARILLHFESQSGRPGGHEPCDARDLLRLLLKLEQGRIVDAFSSREMKRLMYMTQRRIRFASSPALSGCGRLFQIRVSLPLSTRARVHVSQYEGNVEKHDELPGDRRIAGRQIGTLHYLVALMSNVAQEEFRGGASDFCDASSPSDLVISSGKRWKRRRGSGEEAELTGCWVRRVFPERRTRVSNCTIRSLSHFPPSGFLVKAAAM